MQHHTTFQYMLEGKHLLRQGKSDETETTHISKTMTGIKIFY